MEFGGMNLYFYGLINNLWVDYWKLPKGAEMGVDKSVMV